MHFFLSNSIAENSIAENLTLTLHSWKRGIMLGRSQECKFRLLTKTSRVVCTKYFKQRKENKCKWLVRINSSIFFY